MDTLRRRAGQLGRLVACSGPGLTIVFLFGIFLSGVWPRAGLAESPPDRPPTDLTAPPPVPVDLDAQAAYQHALNQLLPRNLSGERILSKARSRLREYCPGPPSGVYCSTSGQPSTDELQELVDELQALLDVPVDSFTSSPVQHLSGTLPTEISPPHLAGRPESTPRSLRRATEDLIASSDPLLSLYRRVTSSTAQTLADDARRGDAQAATTLLRSYRLSTQARDHLFRKTTVTIDTGEFDVAEHLLNQLAEWPGLSVHDIERLIQLRDALTPQSSTGVQLASTEFTVQPTETPLPRIKQTWLTPSGSLSGNAQFAAIGPILGPVWSVRLGDDDVNADGTNNNDKSTGPAIDRWLASQRENHVEPIGPRSVVVSKDRLITRETTGLVARQLTTGQHLWSAPSASALSQLLSGLDDSSSRSLIENRLTVDSVLGELTADTDHVYWIERVTSGRESTTRLVATRLDDGTRAWSQQARPSGVHSLNAGDCHWLSPPTPTAHGLMVVAEVHGQLELRALSAATGQLCWAQPIATADTPASRERLRLHLSCRPTVADGLVVCNTQLGTLVAVDAQTGTLRWVRAYAEMTSGPGGRPRSISCRQINEPAYPNQPMIAEGVVYAMPVQALNLYAIALETGHVLWHVGRENASTIALVDTPRHQIILVGHRFVRAVSMTDGSEHWRTRTPIAGGRGVGVGREFLLPLASGQTARLDLTNGQLGDDTFRKAATPLSAPEATAGHLAVVRDWVIRCGPVSITVSSRGESVRRAAQARLQNGPDTTATIALARVELASAAPQKALEHLSQIRVDHLTGQSRREYEHLLRETLFATLPGHPTTSQPDAVFAQLNQLATTPAQTARVLVHRTTSALDRGHVEDAVLIAEKLASLTDSRDRTGRINRGQHVVTAPALATQLLSRLSVHDRAQLQIADDADVLSQWNATPEEQRQFLTLFGHHAEAAPVHLARGQTLAAAGASQAAELQLLLAVRDSDTETRVHAQLALAGLYGQHERYRDAATVWATLLDEAEDFSVADGITVGQLAQFITNDHPVGRALRQRRPFHEPAYAAAITTTTHDRSSWADWYGDVRRQNMTLPPGFGLDVLDTGYVPESRTVAQWRLVPRESRTPFDASRVTTLATINVPAYYSHPSRPRYHKRVGHVLPLGLDQPIAVSLLEGRVLWKIHTEQLARPEKTITSRQTKARVAAVGPDYCLIQQRHRLTAVHPLDGQLLWARDDLDARSGLWFDNAADGLFADSERTVVFDADGVGYTIYSTITGECLTRGRLERRGVSVRRTRHAGSRYMFYLAKFDETYHYRLWDAGHPSAPPPLDIPAGPHFKHLIDRFPGPPGQGDRVAFVDRDGVVTVIDLANGQRVVTAHLPNFSWDDASELNVFEQNGLVFVDIAPAGFQRQGASSLSTSTVAIPSRSLGGQLTAIRPDREGQGEVLWSQDVGRCTVLSGPEFRLPVLLLAAGIDGQSGQPRRTRLTIVNATTGDELAQTSDLPNTPLLRWDYEPLAAEVRLFGPEMTVAIKFGHLNDVARWKADNQPTVQQTEFVSIER